MAIRILLVESNPEIQDDLFAKLAFYPNAEIADIVNTTEDAVEYLKTHEVDALFTNIQPAEANVTSDGVSLALYCATNYPDVQTVLYGEERQLFDPGLVSAAYEYLSYPINPIALPYIMNRMSYIWQLQQKRQDNTERKIVVRTKGGYQMVPVQKVLYIERIERKNHLILEDGSDLLLERSSLEELEEELKNSVFFRCYQSYLVNLSKIETVKVNSVARSYSILFADKKREIMVSRSRYAQLIELLKKQYRKEL